MTDEELIAELEALGVDAESYRVIALLPLIRVAWADGDFHEKEREVILLAAQRHQLVAGDGPRLLKGWLDQRPSDEDFARGTRVLRALLKRGGSATHDLSDTSPAELLQLCELVAVAAGGLFGLVFSVSAAERAAVAEIAAALHEDEAAIAPPDQGDDLEEDFDDEAPTIKMLRPPLPDDDDA